MAGKLYVGCGLTYAPDHFKEQVKDTKEALRADWDVLEFLGLDDGTPADVYRTDILENVHRCDAFIGICDEPSTGLGWELSTAATLGKPMLATVHRRSKLTRLVMGAPDFNPNMVFERYDDMTSDVPRIAGSLLLPKVQR